MVFLTLPLWYSYNMRVMFMYMCERLYSSCSVPFRLHCACWNDLTGKGRLLHRVKYGLSDVGIIGPAPVATMQSDAFI